MLSMWARFAAMFVFWCCALAFGIWHGGVTAWFIVCSLGVTLAYLLLVYLSSFRSLDIKVKIEHEQYMSDEDAAVTFTIRHNSWLPLFWLVIEQNWINVTNSKNWTFREIFFPGFRRSITGKYKIKNVQRGEYQSRRVEAFTGDVFGLITKRKALKPTEGFIVYPNPLTILPNFTHLLYGSESSFDTPIYQQDSPDFSGVRDYAMGDPMNRIHWKSTARTNALKTNERHTYSQKRVMVALDAGKTSYLSDLPVSLFEKCVQVAASLLKYAKENNVTSGLVCSNNEGNRLLFSDYSSLQSSYTLLSGVRPDGELPFYETLLREKDRLSHDTMLLCVTANVNDYLLDSIQQLRSKNISVSILFIHSTAALSWHQMYLKQRMQSMNCLFYSIQHTKVNKQHTGGIEHVG